MTVESLWTLEFQTVNEWNNGGVAVFETGRIFGGDSCFYYLGTYTVSEKQVLAKVAVQHYFGENYTAFGDKIDAYVVELMGTLDGDLIGGTMKRLDKANLPILQMRLIRRADLP
ncbi:MAG: hypothetical protein ACTSUD_03420 [Alphaproteobacteria bacterium]